MQHNVITEVENLKGLTEEKEEDVAKIVTTIAVLVPRSVKVVANRGNKTAPNVISVHR